jgi:hypothetical protein
MAKIEFPRPLKELLEDSNLQAPIRSLADRVGELLADNKLPFFPDYTESLACSEERAPMSPGLGIRRPRGTAPS